MNPLERAHRVERDAQRRANWKRPGEAGLWLDRRKTTRFKLDKDNKVTAVERNGEVATWVSCDEARRRLRCREGLASGVLGDARHLAQDRHAAPCTGPIRRRWRCSMTTIPSPGPIGRARGAAGGACEACQTVSQLVPAPSGGMARWLAIVWPISAKVSRLPNEPGFMPLA